MLPHFELKNGTIVFVNPFNVSAVLPEGDHTAIAMNNGSGWTVMGDPTKVATEIWKALKDAR